MAMLKYHHAFATTLYGFFRTFQKLRNAATREICLNTANHIQYLILETTPNEQLQAYQTYLGHSSLLIYIL